MYKDVIYKVVLVDKVDMRRGGSMLAIMNVMGIFLAVFLFSVAPAQAFVINGVTAEASSYWVTMPPSTVVNGAGLNTSVDPNTHTSTDWSSSWETQPYLNSGTITFDLNSSYNVGSFRVWNFNLVNQNGSYTGRGARDVNISTKADGGSWSSPVAYVFDVATGQDSYTGQLFSGLDWNNVRYIQFDIRSIYGYGDAGGHAGLSEVRFFTAETSNPNAVPEPASMLLLGLGGAGLAVTRRKKL